MIKVQRVLISVSDKKGIIPFAKALHQRGAEILSTGGTANHLKNAAIPVKEVSEYTGFPEMLDGRVKTLHPKIHAGLLALRQNKEHMDKLKQHQIDLIDMVVVNLYPFESVTQRKNVTLEEAIENIDIGGPAMLRSAAKNYKSVAVVCNPDRYDEIVKELEVNSGILSDAVLFRLAVEAFGHTARYDSVIADFLGRRTKSEEFSLLPAEITFKFKKIQDLRYGENPHQKASFYSDEDGQAGLAAIKQFHGKELSYNNILDLHAAVEFIRGFKQPTAVIIKHNNPTGLAEDTTLAKAYQKAWQCDPVSAFGGIIGLNRKVDTATAKKMIAGGFMECIIAPGFEEEAYRILAQKKNIRLIDFDFSTDDKETFDFKKVSGGLLLQEKDRLHIGSADLKVVTKKKPTKSQMDSLLFGWEVIRSIKSNAIILVKDRRTVGIGCGQTSRVESVRLAISKAGKEAKGSLLVSDAFLPKIDNVQLAAKAGIKAIIQTGGSVADQDVIKEADKRHLIMIMTGVRHFKH